MPTYYRPMPASLLSSAELLVIQSPGPSLSEMLSIFLSLSALPAVADPVLLVSVDSILLGNAKPHVYNWDQVHLLVVAAAAAAAAFWAAVAAFFDAWAASTAESCSDSD